MEKCQRTVPSIAMRHNALRISYGRARSVWDTRRVRTWQPSGLDWWTRYFRVSPYGHGKPGEAARTSRVDRIRHSRRCALQKYLNVREDSLQYVERSIGANLRF